MNDTTLKRATVMLLRGGKDVIPAFESVLGSDGWTRFPPNARDTIRLIWENQGRPVSRYEEQLDRFGQDWLLQIDREQVQERGWSYEDMAAVAGKINNAYIKELSAARLGKLSEQASNGAEPDQIVNGISELLADLRRHNAEGRLLIASGLGVDSGVTLLDEWINGEANKSMIRTGFSSIDKQALLERGELLAIIGATGVGKSALAFQMAANVAKGMRAQKRAGCVLVFNMEMLASRLFIRLAAADTSINPNHIRQGVIKRGERPEFRQALQSYSDLPLVFCERSGLKMSAIKRLVDQASREHGGIEMILLDYADLAQPDTKVYNETQATDAIYMEFRSIIHNHINPDGTKPAGVIVGRTLKKSDEGQRAPVLLPIEKIIRGAGHYHLGAAIVPVAIHQHIAVSDDGQSSGAPDILSTLVANGRAPQDIDDDDRLLWVPKSRHGWTGTIVNYRFRAEYTRWEEKA